MADKISYIHAADLHLDSPFKGFADAPEHILKNIRESTFQALDQLVKQAIKKEVDFVLLTGDLFDNERQSLKAQIRLRNAFEQLHKYHIQVYLSFGNHDFIEGNVHPVTYPDNVFVFPDGQIHHFIYEKNGKKLAAIYGFSYEQRALTENMAKHFYINDNERHIPYHIAMLHGSLGKSTEHDTYAPFQMADLTKENFDYWALGHIHQREILKEQQPAIVYPGNTQGRSSKEMGAKGCYYVVLGETRPTLDFVPLAPVTFHKLSVHMNQVTELQQLETILMERMKQIKSETESQLIKLELLTENYMSDEIEEIREVVNEQILQDRYWQYIYRVDIHIINQDEIANGQYFAAELARHFADASIQPYMEELFNHKIARKYLSAMSSTQIENLKSEAQALLLQELLRQ